RACIAHLPAEFSLECAASLALLRADAQHPRLGPRCRTASRSVPVAAGAADESIHTAFLAPRRSLLFFLAGNGRRSCVRLGIRPHDRVLLLSARQELLLRARLPDRSGRWRHFRRPFPGQATFRCTSTLKARTPDRRLRVAACFHRGVSTGDLAAAVDRFISAFPAASAVQSAALRAWPRRRRAPTALRRRIRLAGNGGASRPCLSIAARSRPRENCDPRRQLRRSRRDRLFRSAIWTSES